MNADHNITFETIVGHVTGELPADQSATLTQQAEADASLARMIAAIRSVITALREPLDNPTEAALARARQLIDLQVGVLPFGFEPAGLVIAELVEDTRDPSSMYGLRGEATAYQLSFEADYAEVHLHVTSEAGGTCRVRGQVDVFEPSNDDIRVALRRSGRESLIETKADDTGQFKLEVEPATYDVIVSVGLRTLLVPSVEIG